MTVGGALLALLALLIGAAQAATPEEWAGLYNGRLAAAIDRDPVQAITIYEAILSNLSATDPLRGDLLYWLGRAHYEVGDLDAARAALLGAAAAPRGANDPREIADSLRTWSGRIQTVPARTQPEAKISGDAVWRLAFDELPKPVNEIRLRLRSEGGATVVRVDLMTLDGRRLPSLESVELPADEWTDLTLEMSDFRSVQGAETGRLWLLSLQQHAESARVDVAIRIAEVEIR